MYAEPRLPEETIQALIDAGYEVDSGKDWNTSLGSVGVVLVDPDDGFVYAGGDNRRQYQVTGLLRKPAHTDTKSLMGI